jgi:DSBA-like thioredoxin domain-containing protein
VTASEISSPPLVPLEGGQRCVLGTQASDQPSAARIYPHALEKTLFSFASWYSALADSRIDQLVSHVGAELACADSPGLTRSDFLAALESKRYHEHVWDAVQRCAQERVFGVPTFVVNEKRFWGNDRIDFLLEELRGVA